MQQPVCVMTDMLRRGAPRRQTPPAAHASHRRASPVLTYPVLTAMARRASVPWIAGIAR